LFKLSSLASMQGYYRKPRMDRELISENHEGIIATTGCPSGEVQTRLRLGQKQEAIQAASDYKDIFGGENFFLELMDHGLPIERSVREGLLEIGKLLDLKPIATNDSHYVTKDQADTHSALLCVQAGKTLNDPTRFKFDGDGYYLKSAAEMREYWDSEVEGAADNTLLIAERIAAGAYAEVFAHRDRMPVFTVPDGHDEASWLRAEVTRGLARRFPDGAPERYRARLETELQVIIGKGFPAYFLVVADLVGYAREVGIRVGPGRGSAAGSLVAYVLGITNIDPIPQKLLFERFLNPERASMPDIDIDFDDRRRGELIRYATDKYGADKVAQVITFGTIKTKAAIKDAARVRFGQPGYAIADKITKALPPSIQGKDISLSGIVDPAHERYAEAAEARTLVETDPDCKTIFETARGLEGLIRNAGVHACAVILSREPLIDAVPLWRREDDGALITGWDYPSCEGIGLLKMDFLGLRYLTIMGDTIDNIATNRGIDIDLDTLALDDEAAYRLLGSGDTLGIFQLESGPVRDLLRRMKPTGFDDIVAVLALYRPGPMGMNAHNDYADRKNQRQTIIPIHPELEEPLAEILADTYGLIVYQEQIMLIAQKVAGYSMGRADTLRRAMGKKKIEILEQEYAAFEAGMTAGGFSPAAVKALWDTVLPFAGYAFNKSHAAAYGLIAYWTAYLKAHYPAEYVAALLTSVSGNKDKSAGYLAECRRLGIRVLPPDVNESAARFAAVGEDIRFGLGAVRNVGTNVVESIIATRAARGKFTSFTDVLDHADLVVCNKRVVESLIKAGAFDSFGHTRLAMMRVHDEAVDAVVSLKRKEELGQFDLFGPAAGDSAASSSVLAHLRFDDEVEYPPKIKLGNEREMLGLYVSAHPLDGAEHILRRHAPRPIGAIIADPPTGDAEVVVAGLITGLERKVNKRGEPWAIATVEDLDGSIEVLFFPRAYMLYADELAEDNAVVVKGRVSWREDTMSVFANALLPVDLSESAVVGERPPFVLLAAASSLDLDVVHALRLALQAHPGPTPVHVRLIGPTPRTFTLPEYSVTPSASLIADITAISGIAVKR
ncbi:DNA polymerase III subunit alpha, partial [Amycolatopsis sp. NPDC059657]|uniref:DNA polymerase III subunit alpha n=1 Tax=Amycolatopsis sp. NPDC059657 TaxID=3346899 RepID=UPI00366DFB2B